jgi:hypothetical protein
MNTASSSLIRQALEWIEQRPMTRTEPFDDSRTNRPSASIWENAWVDCLVQACVATPWIIVSAIGRLLLQCHR